MKRYSKLMVIIGGIVALGLVVAGVVAALPVGEVASHSFGAVIPQPDVTVRAYPSFARDIQPIFSEFCVQCHSSQGARNGLRLDSYEGVIKGTQFGTVILAGDPAMSPLVALIKHESDPKIWMPYHKEQLSPNRMKNIENWIRYGARNN